MKRPLLAAKSLPERRLAEVSAAVALLATGLCLWVSPAAAQPVQPERYLVTTSVGVPLRLSRNLDLDQGTVAPIFTDVMVGYTLPGQIRLRHGFALGASINLSEEGGFTTPVGVGEQIVLMPAYLLYYDMSADWIGLAHAGIPFNIAGGTTVGVELAGGLAYRLRAGFGLFGELGLSVYPGAESTMHPAMSLELGVVLDYEVLP